MSMPRCALPTPRVELLVIGALMWILLAAIPISLGGIGISWDALNHHVYLGWTAFSPRFEQDWLAASHQAYQYPYLYWPFYTLAQAGVSGTWAGIALVSLHMPMVPALWLVARTCIPAPGWEGVALRSGAVLLAFLGELALSLMDTTANDLYAASPLVWAVALTLLADSDAASPPRWLTVPRLLALSGLCTGVAVAFKLSNGPLALVMPFLWALAPGTPARRTMQVVQAGAWSIAGFVLAYGPWGWELWYHFGNPMYPFYDNGFEILRQFVGWRQP